MALERLCEECRQFWRLFAESSGEGFGIQATRGGVEAEIGLQQSQVEVVERAIAGEVEAAIALCEAVARNIQGGERFGVGVAHQIGLTECVP